MNKGEHICFQKDRNDVMFGIIRGSAILKKKKIHNNKGRLNLKTREANIKHSKKR